MRKEKKKKERKREKFRERERFWEKDKGNRNIHKIWNCKREIGRDRVFIKIRERKRDREI